MQPERPSIWLHDSIENASGKPGALQAPAYDLLSTVAYIPEDDAALKFHRSRAWASFTYEELTTMADRARLPARLVVARARETVERFDAVWEQEKRNLTFADEVIAAIDQHRARLAI